MYNHGLFELTITTTTNSIVWDCSMCCHLPSHETWSTLILYPWLHSQNMDPATFWHKSAHPPLFTLHSLTSERKWKQYQSISKCIVHSHKYKVRDYNVKYCVSPDYSYFYIMTLAYQDMWCYPQPR